MTIMANAEKLNGVALPESRQAAVQQGLHYYQEVAFERDQLATEVARLRTDLSGHKVALEAMEAQLLESQSRVETAMLVRDQAVADRAKWESLFIGIYAQMRAFGVPAAPLVKEADPDSAPPVIPRRELKMRAAVVLIALLLSSDAARSAASECLNKSEARQMYPRSWLYWRNVEGQRCWGDRRGGRSGLRLHGPRSQRGTLPPSPSVIPDEPPLPDAEPLPMIPPELVPMIPGPEQWRPDFPPLPPPRPRAEIVYSTFRGEAPDVWPALNPQPQLIGLLAMVLSAAVAFAAGMYSRGETT